MAKKPITEDTIVQAEAPALITVTATGPLSEGGTFYPAGATFETTILRATALGSAVTIPSPE